MDTDETASSLRSKAKSARKPAVAKTAATKTTAAGAKAAPNAAAVAAAPRKPRVPAPAAKPTVAVLPAVPDTSPAAKGPMLKKKDLIDRVVAAVGGKKKGVKEIVEATLAAIGDALSKGEDLNLPPLGRAHVNRQRDLDGGEMMMVKLRRADAADPAKPKRKEALAEADQES